MKRSIAFALMLAFGITGVLQAQDNVKENVRWIAIAGKIQDTNEKDLTGANIKLVNTAFNKVIDETGALQKAQYKLKVRVPGKYLLIASKKGYMFYSAVFDLTTEKNKENLTFDIMLTTEKK